jgi:predicted MFS family arabinose efflux permease
MHHPDRSPLHHLLHTLSNRSYVLGFLATGTLSLGGFMLMPFMSVFVVNNVGLPVAKLPLVYMITGAFSIVTGPLIGWSSDAFGRLRVFGFGCAVTIVMVAIYTHLSAVGLGTLVTVMVLMQIGIFSRMIRLRPSPRHCRNQAIAAPTCPSAPRSSRRRAASPPCSRG